MGGHLELGRSISRCSAISLQMGNLISRWAWAAAISRWLPPIFEMGGNLKIFRWLSPYPRWAAVSRTDGYVHLENIKMDYSNLEMGGHLQMAIPPHLKMADHLEIWSPPSSFYLKIAGTFR